MTDELEMCMLKADWQQEKIDELTKERDYLKEQLAAGKSEDTVCNKIIVAYIQLGPE